MMLKTMRNTGLAGTGMLLIIGVVSVAATRQFTFQNRTLNDSTVRQLFFDTVRMQLKGNFEMDSFAVPAITLNKQASEFTKSYIAENRDVLEMIRRKSATPFRIIEGVFSKYGIPLEMKYLAVIESELKSTALSRVGARGPWQLMPGTARILSLRVDGKRDERTHLYKSTVAVARYLRDLYQLFGDWPLVIAAYNSGPGKVYVAIKKSGSRNFWKLQRFLPAETRGHVKKFIGTHYYFEGKAGLTTLTKDETIAFRKKMIEFVEIQNACFREQQIAEATETGVIAKKDIVKTITPNPESK